jgi:hypothetical protein
MLFMSKSEVTHTAPVNREDWLNQLSEALRPLIKERTGLTVHKFQISCGFPSVRARSSKNGRIGECWSPEGRDHEIFIHPRLADPIQVAETAAHELLHASLPPKTGHKKPFARAAVALGLEGKPTATYAGDDLREALQAIVTKLGPYPHVSLDSTGFKKQETRLLKVGCPVCGYIIRVTSKWLDSAGAPFCPQCDIQMTDDCDGPSDPLVAVDQNVEYKVRGEDKKDPFDPRWSLRMTRSARNIRWYVIDYGEHILGAELPRLTPAETREEALNLMEALRSGLMTYEDLTIDDNDDDLDAKLDAEWLDDSEDEDPDYPDDQPEDEQEYEAQKVAREAGMPHTSGNVEREIGSWQYKMNL